MSEKLIQRTAVFTVTAVLILILLIQFGLFDPKPIGALQWETAVPTHPYQEQEIIWLTDMPSSEFSVRATAVWQYGELDSQYGLVLGQPEDYVAVIVAPTGYTAVWQQTAQTTQDHIQFSPWPHIKTENNPNEIWIDVEQDQVTVRVNRELLWQEKIGVGSETAVSSQIGILAQSFHPSPSHINFPTIQLFSPN